MKNKILIAGAGGAPSEGVIYSLLKNPDNYIIGMGSEPSDLILSKAHKKYSVPYCYEANYKKILLSILYKEKPDLVHFQNDLEIYHASKIRKDIQNTGTKIFMPNHSVIDKCVHKYKSYIAFKESGIVVPKSEIVTSENILKNCFEELADKNGFIWLRDSRIGGGGKGALPTNDYYFAKSWIDFHDGWGNFIAAEMLTNKTVTWLSIWHKGELIVAQSRIRNGWEHANRTVSGITGITKSGMTFSNKTVTQVAINSIMAIDSEPHGIYGVDMTYDKNKIPNPTEINISRFFTTIRFFTEAGVNFPEIFKKLALGEKINFKKGTINPLKNNLLWIRGMDTNPLLISKKEYDQKILLSKKF